MNIILIGYRASGKTTLGKLLAERLWMTFTDVDDEICKRFDNKTIAQIWDEFGESSFREVETQVTLELCQKREMIIGLGGGTLMEPAAREAVEQADAVRIYLKCEPKVLWVRIQQDARSTTCRPSLTRLGGGLEEINAVLEQRGPVYEAVADKTLDISRLEKEDAIRFLIDRCL